MDQNLKRFICLVLSFAIGLPLPASLAVADDSSTAVDWERSYREQLEGMPLEIRQVLEAKAQDVLNAEEADRAAKIVVAETAAAREALNAVSIPASQLNTQEKVDKYVAENDFVVGQPTNIDGLKPKFYLRLARAIGSWILKSHGVKLTQYMDNLVNSLRLPGDTNRRYEVHITGSMDPTDTMAELQSNVIQIPLGIILFARDEGELLGVIAHEITHTNQEHMDALRHDEVIEETIEGVKIKVNESDLRFTLSQREEIRAELGGADRLIHAKYSPWGLYNFRGRVAQMEAYARNPIYRVIFSNKRLKKISKFFESHPASEVFRAATTAYVMRQTGKQDLSKLLVKKHPYPKMIQTLRMQSRALAMLIHVQEAFSLKRILTVGGTYVGGWGLIELVKWIFSGAASAGSSGVYNDDPNPFLLFILNPWTLGIGLSFLIFSYIKSKIVARMDALNQYLPHIQKIDEILRWANALLGQEHISPKDMLELFKKSNYLIYLTKILIPQDTRIDKERAWINRMIKADLVHDLYLRTLDYLSKTYIPQIPTADRALLNRYWIVFTSFDKSFKVETKVNTWVDWKNQIERLIRGKPVKLAYQTDFLMEERPTQDRLRLVSKALTQKFSRAYDLEKALGERVSAKSLPGELTFEYRLRLVLTETAALKALSGEEKYTILKAAKDANLPQLFVRVLTAEYDAIKKYAESTPTTKEMEGLVELIRFGEFPEKFFKDVRKRARAESEGEGDRFNVLAQQAFPYEFPLEGEFDTGYFKGHMRGLKSIIKVAAYVDQNLVAYNANTNIYNKILVDLVQKNLDWIDSVAAVDTVLARPYFWKSMGTSIYSRSEVEQQMLTYAKGKTQSMSPIVLYDVPTSSKLHERIIQVLKENGAYPTNFDGLFALWKRLTDRGVSLLTDGIAENLLDMAKRNELPLLETAILEERRVWDPDLNSRVARAYILRMKYVEQINAADGSARTRLVDTMIRDLKRISPSEDVAYRELIEEISSAIQSTEVESHLLEEAKGKPFSRTTHQDAGLRTVTMLLEKALAWSKSEQFALIRYLRNDGPSFPALEKEFPVMGPERVRRMIDKMPIELKTAFVFAPLLDSKRGPTHGGKMTSFWGKQLLDYILGNADGKSRQITEEVMKALFYAIEKTGGNVGLKNYALAHILSVSPGEMKSPGDVLRIVLSAYGAMGVKIAQNIVAARILPDEETEKLRQVQDNANPPTREEMYTDLRRIFSHSQIPFRVRQLLGAASLKYAFLYETSASARPAVGKVLRESAIHRTQLEFNQVDYMVEYLVENYGAKYGILRAIGRASREAVTRELDLHQEALRSLQAKDSVYARPGKNLAFQVPRDAFVSGSFLVSEFANGVPFYELPDNLKGTVAEKLLGYETEVLFGDRDRIIFDPDRHAGNFRVDVRDTGTKLQVTLQPFDFGQLTSVTRAQRENILNLFTYAQIMREIGVTDQLVSLIAKEVGIDAGNLKKELEPYFKPDMNPLTSYYAVLAGLEAVNKKMPIEFFDFIRGILQLNQYEPFAQGAMTPQVRLRQEVEGRSELLRSRIQMSWKEKLAYVRYVGVRKALEQYNETRNAKPLSDCESRAL